MDEAVLLLQIAELEAELACAKAELLRFRLMKGHEDGGRESKPHGGKTMHEQIAEVLKAKGWAKPTEIVKQIPDRSPQYVRKGLYEMLTKGTVERNEDHYYALAA